MVDCRSAVVEGGATGAVDIAKVLQHILLWMAGVTRWNVVFMLAPTNSAIDIGQKLSMFDARTYTFPR
jgi:hypothetical protein